eukprot:191521_1
MEDDEQKDVFTLSSNYYTFVIEVSKHDIAALHFNAVGLSPLFNEHDIKDQNTLDQFNSLKATLNKYNGCCLENFMIQIAHNVNIDLNKHYGHTQPSKPNCIALIDGYIREYEHLLKTTDNKYIPYNIKQLFLKFYYLTFVNNINALLKGDYIIAINNRHLKDIIIYWDATNTNKFIWNIYKEYTEDIYDGNYVLQIARKIPINNSINRQITMFCHRLSIEDEISKIDDIISIENALSRSINIPIAFVNVGNIILKHSSFTIFHNLCMPEIFPSNKHIFKYLLQKNNDHFFKYHLYDFNFTLTPLICIMQWNVPKCFELIYNLKKHMFVNAHKNIINYPIRGWSLLSRSICEDPNVVISQILIEKCGANVNIRNKELCNSTILYKLALNCNKDEKHSDKIVFKLLKLLIKNKVDINLGPTNNETFFMHFCANCNNIDIIKYIHEYYGNKLDVNNTNIYGESALEYAIYSNNIDIVKYLIENFKCKLNP